MLTALLVSALFSSEPMFETLPADRSKVPYHLQEKVTVAEWYRLDETFAKGEWKFERQLRTMEWRDKRWRENIRESNARSRKLGIVTSPDPEEPTESKFFPKRESR